MITFNSTSNLQLYLHFYIHFETSVVFFLEFLSKEGPCSFGRNMWSILCSYRLQGSFKCKLSINIQGNVLSVWQELHHGPSSPAVSQKLLNPSVPDSLIWDWTVRAKLAHFGLWEEIARYWEIVEWRGYFQNVGSTFFYQKLKLEDLLNHTFSQNSKNQCHEFHKFHDL